MYKYYPTEIIPLILKIFKVKNIIITGKVDQKTKSQILKYCKTCNFINSNQKEDLQQQLNNLTELTKLNNYEAIFINDNPNWYSVYNELNIIKEHNENFPLVFICNNIFPFKRRDAYINPDNIPQKYRNNFSNYLVYKDIHVNDGFYHALNENTEKNGVLTAIEEFLNENESISVMNIKLENGITIIYNNNSINQIRIGKLNNELKNYNPLENDLIDSKIENDLLINYISKFNLSENEFNNFDKITKQLINSEEIINNFANKIELDKVELNYKNTQINKFISKINLKDSEVKKIESELMNKELEINTLNKQLKNANLNIETLQNSLEQNKKDYLNNEKKLSEKILTNETEINSLKSKISKKEQKETEIINQLQNTKKQIKTNIDQINNTNSQINFKNQLIKIKEQEIQENKNQLNNIKKQYTHQLSKLENKEYCINCYKEEINNKHSEIEYLKKETIIKKILKPLGYIYLILKSKPQEIRLNLRLYKLLKNSNCFDIGYYLNNNVDIQKSKWCKYFSPELHYICNGFNEKREFNKKYYNTNSKKELLNYILNCK